MRIPVLTYHAVMPLEGREPVRGTVPLRQFQKQMAWLCEHGFSSLTLGEAAGLLSGETSDAPRRPVVLTFDDGYRCVVEHALPVLERAGLTATLFVVTGAVGQTTGWYVQKGGQPFAHARWDELERARESGFEIGAHGVEHQRLNELGPEELVDEVAGSRQEITKHLGTCDHFAYPYGITTPAAISAVDRAGYRTASTTRAGFNRPGAPLHELRRQNVSRTTTPIRFRRRAGAWW